MAAQLLVLAQSCLGTQLRRDVPVDLEYRVPFGVERLAAGHHDLTAVRGSAG